MMIWCGAGAALVAVTCDSGISLGDVPALFDLDHGPGLFDAVKGFNPVPVDNGDHGLPLDFVVGAADPEQSRPVRGEGSLFGVERA